MIRTFFGILFVFLCACLAGSPDIHAEDVETQPPVVETNKPTLIQNVSLIRTNERISRNSAVSVENLEGGHGSGTYVKHNDHYGILTARHVVDRADIFYVTAGTERVVGQVIWKSETHDIALLRVPKMDSRRAVNISRNDTSLIIGDEVVYSGYPASYNMITTRAYVSGYSQRHHATLLHGFIWFGHSGSGVFDDTGNLVGVVVAVGVETFHDIPQVLEDLVYIHEININHITKIRHALR